MANSKVPRKACAFRGTEGILLFNFFFIGGPAMPRGPRGDFIEVKYPNMQLRLSLK